MPSGTTVEEGTTRAEVTGSSEVGVHPAADPLAEEAGQPAVGRPAHDRHVPGRAGVADPVLRDQRLLADLRARQLEPRGRIRLHRRRLWHLHPVALIMVSGTHTGVVARLSFPHRVCPHWG